MKTMPKILYLISCWPHQEAYGGQLRALHVGRALRQIGEVTISVVTGDGSDEGSFCRAQSEFFLERSVRVEFSPNRRFFQRFRWALDPHFLNVHGCVANSQDRAYLLSLFPKFDLIWIQNARTP